MNDLETLTDMESCLLAFKAGRLPIHQLVADLRDSEQCLLHVAGEWKEQFMKRWFVLEEVNAVLLDEQGAEAVESHSEITTQAAGALLEMIQTAKAMCLDKQ